MARYQEILEYNRHWATEKLDNDSSYFDELAKQQNPEFLFIGCSDSRVSVKELLGVDLGEIFVHRNIANLVISIDANAMSVINYAVNYLNVKEIIICGHYNCNGVKAAMESKDYGELNGWLRNIRDVYRMNREELSAIAEPEKRYRRLVELNVIEQCRNLIKTAPVQTSYVEKGYPTIHGWVVDLQTGLINDLQIDYEAILTEIQEIFNITGKPLVKDNHT